MKIFSQACGCTSDGSARKTSCGELIYGRAVTKDKNLSGRGVVPELLAQRGPQLKR